MVTVKGNKIWIEGNLWLSDEREMGFVQGKRHREVRKKAAERRRRGDQRKKQEEKRERLKKKEKKR